VALDDLVKEVVMVSDLDFLGRYLNLFFITKSCTLKYLYSDTAGFLWYELPTSITDARRGLDACTHQGYANYYCYAYATYITTNHSLQVDGFTNDGDQERLARRRLVSPGQSEYSDHASFWRQGYVAFCGIERDFTPMYHTIGDTRG